MEYYKTHPNAKEFENDLETTFRVARLEDGCALVTAKIDNGTTVEYLSHLSEIDDCLSQGKWIAVDNVDYFNYI